MQKNNPKSRVQISHQSLNFCMFYTMSCMLKKIVPPIIYKHLISINGALHVLAVNEFFGSARIKFSARAFNVSINKFFISWWFTGH